jgi:hypothetical protein
MNAEAYPDISDYLVRLDDGLIQFQLDHITYNVSPIEVLDANLASCLASHRDALLEVRAYLYERTSHNALPTLEES